MNVVGQLMWTLSFDNLSFWVFAFVVLIVLGLVWIHDRRQELRKLWYGGYSSTKRMIKFLGFFFVALLIIVGVIFFSGDGLYERLLSFRGESGPSPILEAQKEIDAMKQELDPLREQRASLRKKLDEAQSAWNAKVQTEFGANGTEIQQLIQHELTLRQQIGATLVNRDVMADLAKGLDQTITQSKDLQTEIDASQAELASLHRTRAITRVELDKVCMSSRHGLSAHRPVRRLETASQYEEVSGQARKDLSDVRKSGRHRSGRVDGQRSRDGRVSAEH